MLASRVMKLGGTRVWFRKVSLLAGYDQERMFVEGCIRREDKQLQRGLLNAKVNASSFIQIISCRKTKVQIKFSIISSKLMDIKRFGVIQRVWQGLSQKGSDIKQVQVLGKVLLDKKTIQPPLSFHYRSLAYEKPSFYILVT